MVSPLQVANAHLPTIAVHIYAISLAWRAASSTPVHAGRVAHNGMAARLQMQQQYQPGALLKDLAACLVAAQYPCILVFEPSHVISPHSWPGPAVQRCNSQAWDATLCHHLELCLRIPLSGLTCQASLGLNAHGAAGACGCLSGVGRLLRLAVPTIPQPGIPAGLRLLQAARFPASQLGHVPMGLWDLLGNKLLESDSPVCVNDR